MNGLEPRLLCAQTLLRMQKQNSYGNLALGTALNRMQIPGADGQALSHARRLCHALFMSTLERLITLDACIAALCKRKPESLDAEVRAVLRCGLCELLTMRTLESAAVNLWTECIKKMHKTSAAGMVNAVLRQFLRQARAVPVPADPIAAMSVRYSVPETLAKQMTDDYGAAQAEAFFADALGAPPLYVRMNPLADGPADPDVTLTPVPEVPGACRIEGLRHEDGEDAAESAVFESGRFHVQDLASQLCCLALDPQPGETVLDVCAAPGGKSFTAAELMHNEGKLLSYDLHPHRVKLIAEGAKRLGLTCIEAAVGDARHPAADRPAADRVLCDVPCSGFGVMRRKPEVRYKSPAEIAGLPALQSEILEASAGALRSGGVLVYSTCTTVKAENEGIVLPFLERHPEFELTEPFARFPAIAEKTGGSRCVTLMPQMLHSDGFFLAKLMRR